MKKYVDYLNSVEVDAALHERTVRRLRQSPAAPRRKRTGLRFAGLVACMVMIIAVIFAMPNGNIPVNGTVIIGKTLDDFYSPPEQANFENPVYISPMLQNAIDSAKPGDLIKTVVYVSGFWEYREAFEVDGVNYGEIWQYWNSGVWKSGVPPENASEKAKFEANPDEYIKNLLERVDAMAEAAKTKAIADLSLKAGVLAVTQDEYPYRHTFIANLSSEQIKVLENEKCFMKLWSLESLEDEPGGEPPPIT